MKGLKKIALASAIAAVAAGAQAELKALDDSVMSEMTGQAGLTIDLETKWSIGEFAYQDAGLVVLKDLSMGGNANDKLANDMLDNIRMEIDIAGSGAATPSGPDNVLKYGFSNVKNLALVHVLNGNKDAGLFAAAKGAQSYIAKNGANEGSFDVDTGLRLDDEVAYNDGDLKIHFTFTDAWQKGGGFSAFATSNGESYDGSATGLSLGNVTYAQAKEIAQKAVDFNFNIGQIALADSGYSAAGRLGQEVIEKTDHTTGLDASANTTTLISDLSIKGYLGPADIHIENNGNGFGGGTGRGAADSKIHWDSFFRVTDLDVYIDIAGVQINDLKIHNTRGDLSSLNQVVQRDASGAAVLDASGNPVMVNTTAFGFAHAKRDIYAVKDAVLNLATLSAQTGANPAGFVDGIAINTRCKADIDIGSLSFGDTGTSIGSLYITDAAATTNWTISAH